MERGKRKQERGNRKEETGKRKEEGNNYNKTINTKINNRSRKTELTSCEFTKNI